MKGFHSPRLIESTARPVIIGNMRIDTTDRSAVSTERARSTLYGRIYLSIRLSVAEYSGFLIEPSILR